MNCVYVTQSLASTLELVKPGNVCEVLTRVSSASLDRSTMGVGFTDTRGRHFDSALINQSCVNIGSCLKQRNYIWLPLDSIFTANKNM